MNALDDLKRAAVAYAQAVDAESLSVNVLRARTALGQAALAYASSLSDFGPGLDPAPHGHFEDTIVRFARQCFGEIGIGDPPRGWQWRAVGWSFDGHELVDVGSIELGSCGPDSVQWELRDCSFSGVTLLDPASPMSTTAEALAREVLADRPRDLGAATVVSRAYLEAVGRAREIEEDAKANESRLLDQIAAGVNKTIELQATIGHERERIAAMIEVAEAIACKHDLRYCEAESMVPAAECAFDRGAYKASREVADAVKAAAKDGGGT